MPWRVVVQTVLTRVSPPVLVRAWQTPVPGPGLSSLSSKLAEKTKREILTSGNTSKHRSENISETWVLAPYFRQKVRNNTFLRGLTLVFSALSRPKHP